MYHSLILESQEVFDRLNKFMEVLETTKYIGFYPDIEGKRIVVFFKNGDDVMRGYEIMNEDFHVQLGIPMHDVDHKWIWRD